MRRASSSRTVRGEHTYGVNTGFGRFVSAHIPDELAEELQLRLLRSHACGVGEPYPDDVVRAAMLLRANALAKGFSGARVVTVELLLECLNRGVLPWVPARGSVGASGDLAPLAHLALPLVGEGQAIVDGELLNGTAALRAVGLEPIRLASKEGLSLVNGTQFMAAMASLGVVRAKRLAATADLACALSLEALQGSRTSFLPAVHRARPLKGQQESAANVWRLLDGSAIIESHRWCDKVQDAYALRCAPQVHGASRDLLDYVEATVTVELNAATDNPLVLVDEGQIVSAGNFHGQPLAFALDALAIAVAELASISERRVERLVNPSLSEGLPPFLVEEGGLNSGFMIPQYVAAALVSENKVLAHPASVDSIPTSAGQEDHVSMGNAAGLKALRVLDNAERTLAIELLAGTQAIEFLAPLQPGDGVRAVHDVVRERSPRLDGGPLAEQRHRARRRGDPRGRDRRRGRVARSERSRDTARDAAVEALCGDLSAIRAPRGSSLNALSWQTEAPLRMLLNNLDSEVAEHPERLVVYGGTGRAARSHEALKDIVRTLLRLRADETLLVQSGKPVGRVPDDGVGAARPHRELAARAALGDLGRVPAARGGGPDDVRPDDGRQLDLHRHAGDPAGDVPDVRGGGRAALRVAGPDRADDPDRRARRDGRRAAARRDDGRRGDSLRRGRPEPDRAAARDAVSRRGRGLARRRARARARRCRREARAVGRGARERRERVPRARRRAASTSTSSPTRRPRTIR